MHSAISGICRTQLLLSQMSGLEGTDRLDSVFISSLIGLGFQGIIELGLSCDVTVEIVS